MMQNKSINCSIRGIKLRLIDKLLFILLIFLLLFTFDCLLHSYQQIKNQTENVKFEAMRADLTAALRDVQKINQQNAEIKKILLEHIWMINASSEAEGDLIFLQRWENFKKVQALVKNTNFSDLVVTSNNNIANDEPSTKYEMTRRYIENGINEMWYFFGSQFKELKTLLQGMPEVSIRVDQILEETLEHKRILLNTSQQLYVRDGYAKWRERESKELRDLVQQRIYHLQYPQNCNSARKLVCEVNNLCGFACQINHIFNCLVEALGTQRTMILQSNEWTDYQPSNWSDVFLPVSNCSYSGQAEKWPGSPDSLEILMTNAHWLYPKAQYLPLGVPRNLASRLARLHGDPAAWWVGQFMVYLMRPQPALTHIIEETMHDFNFLKPIVGVHIRRSDKLITEAVLHTLEEYMQVVEEYYTQLELVQKVEKRRVLIASDDPSVFAEARTKYPTYEILRTQNISLAAGELNSRGNMSGIITDIYYLAQTDYLICTLSSGVCRLAYEIMQTMHPDASAKIRSLDDIYFSSAQLGPRLREVVYQHRSSGPDEIDLDIGDIVEVAGNHWDGYSMGINRRTNKKGLYPSHKVVEKLVLKDFPSL